MLRHGVVLSVLSRSDRCAGEQALDRLRAGAAALPPAHRRAEWYGDFLMHQIQVCTRLGDLHERAAAVEDMRAIAAATGSMSLAARLATVSDPDCLHLPTTDHTTASYSYR